MVELILIACLLARPEHCEQFALPAGPQLTMVQCVWSSQMLAAEWQGQHPGWVIKRLSCAMPRA